MLQQITAATGEQSDGIGQVNVAAAALVLSRLAGGG